MGDVLDLGWRQRDEVALTRAMHEGLSHARIPAPLWLSEWMDQEFKLVPESSAIEGNWETVPFQRDLADCMSNDDIRIMDIIKPGRVGFTKLLVGAALYYATHKKRTGCIMQPTDGLAQRFSRREVGPAIRDCPAVRGAFRGDYNKRGPHNKVDEKAFYGALLWIRGGKSAANYRSDTADFWMYDEAEAFDPDPDGEGSPFFLGDARLTVSPFPKSVRGSTPRNATGSLLLPEIELAGAYFKRYWHCPDCHQPQVLQWGNMRWDDGNPASVRYVCEHCAAPWFYHQITELDEGGFWGTEDGRRIEDRELIGPDDVALPWPRHVAFHLWTAYSPFMTWTELVEEWIEASAQLKRGDPRMLVSFTNMRLAEYWNDASDEVMPEPLMERAAKAGYTRCPAEVRLLTCAVDVQANRLELEVVGHARDHVTWGIEYRVIDGDPEDVLVWDDLASVIAQTFTTEDGRQLQIAAVAVDAGYLPDRVYQFWRRKVHPRVYCLKGWGGMDKPISTAPQQRKSGRSSAPVPLYMMGSDVCKTLVLKRLQIVDPADGGFCHFPPSYDEAYFRSLTAERRITRFRRGFEVIEFEKTRARNEALDIRAMSVFLIEVLNPIWEALDPQNEPEPDVAPDEKKPYIPHAYRHPRRRRR